MLSSILGAHIYIIKFIQFRGTFVHYILFLILAGLLLILTINMNVFTVLFGTGQNCTETKFHKDKIALRVNFDEDTF